MLLERETAIEGFKIAASALPKKGGVVLVNGEAGIGKTTLLEHMRMQLGTDFNMLWSGCDPLFTPRPYGPLHDVADGITDSLLPLLETSAQPSKIFATVYSALETLTKPAILIIEDVHWADHATMDLLKFLVRRIAFVPCLLCLSYRDDEVTLGHPLSTLLNVLPSAHTTRLSLQPLSADAVQKLTQGTPHDANDLHLVSAGNPFFITELLASGDSNEKQIPASIRDAVGSRLAYLAESERAVLQALSLIPYSIPVALIEHLFGASGETNAMACVARKLLTCDANGDFKFRHELGRLATLASVSINQQKQTHTDILIALEELGLDENLAWLVHHAQGAFDAQRVLNYATTAAQRAAAMGAHKEAASYFDKALRFAEQADTEQAAKLYESWAYEVGLTADVNQSVIDARRHAITLWRALGRDDKIGENLRWLSRLYWYQGKATQAEHFANEAIKTFENIPASHERAMAYSMRSQLDMLNDRTEAAINWGKKALALEDEFNNPAVRVHALNNVGSAMLFNGDSSGEALLKESLSLAQKLGLHEDAARVYTNYSDYCVRFKRLALAEKLIADGINFDVAHDLDSWTYYLLGIQAQLRLEQGRLTDAEIISAGVQKLDKQTLLMKLPALTVLARTRARLGIPDCRNQLTQAFENAHATDEYQYMIPARFAIVEHAWLNQHPDEAFTQLKWFTELDDSVLNLWQAGELRCWIKRLGFDLTVNPNLSIAEPYALELQGDILKASRCWQKLGMPFNAAITLMLVDQADAENAYIEANTLLESMQARAALTILRARAKQRGILDLLPRVRRGPYTKTRRHPAGLTAKEQEVLQHLVNGSSNQEIAHALSRSQRTVENHVSSILSKLNVENRIEAMLRVQNEPWLSQ